MNHTPLPNQVDEILQALIQTLPIKATEIGWEKIGEDVADTVQALTDLLADSEIKGRYKEIDKFFNNWGNKKVGQVSSVEIMDYFSDRTDQLQQSLGNKE